MLIPKGNWIVVRRAVRGEDSKRGDIIKGGLTERQARMVAYQHRDVRGFNYWAMPKESY
jgi:hypothetical protein